jgi:Ca2+-binding RTX toxin-like protein
VLVSGDGNDTPKGDGDASLLIGGGGADTLVAGRGNSILIGGYTDYDPPTPANLAALDQLMSAWSSGRVSAASAYLNRSTVPDHGTADILMGGDGIDWFLANLL